MRKLLIIFVFCFWKLQVIDAQSINDTTAVVVTVIGNKDECFALSAYQIRKVDSTSKVIRFLHIEVNNTSQDTMEIPNNDSYFCERCDTITPDYYWDFHKENGHYNTNGIVLIPHHRAKYIKINPNEKYSYTIDYQKIKRYDIDGFIGNRFYINFFYRKTHSIIDIDTKTATEFEYKIWENWQSAVLANYLFDKH
jgi:hypothetical protein